MAHHFGLVAQADGSITSYPHGVC